uniref:Uncharacterized protein n=1 Tax=Trichuris muris TaxID=70415 RepID=A0A5S6QAJ1_TRIMR
MWLALKVLNVLSKDKRGRRPQGSCRITLFASEVFIPRQLLFFERRGGELKMWTIFSHSLLQGHAVQLRQQSNSLNDQIGR